MVGPVDWGAHNGELLETVMAVFVAQDHPNTRRRTPASGDGGVDLMVPAAGGYEVLQVKRFARRIGKNERRQIEDSYQETLTNPRLDKPIRRYSVVVPTDLTPHEQTWFDNLTAEAPWPVDWLGEVHWNSLASKHPHVIDYYFGGGRERIARRSLAAQVEMRDPLQPLIAADFTSRIGALFDQLNADDPHYRYRISISEVEPDPRESLLHGAVLNVTRQNDTGSWSTLTAVPKHDWATRDAPIEVNVSVRFDNGPATNHLSAAIKNFMHFGTAVDLPEGTVSFDVAGPGGMSGSFVDGAGHLAAIPMTTSELPDLEFVLSNGADVVARLPLNVTSTTRGVAGGAEIFVSDDSGLFLGSMRLSPQSEAPAHPSATFSYSVKELGGTRVLQALELIRFLGALKPPNRLQLKERYGSRPIASLELPDSGTPAINSQHFEDVAFIQQFAEEAIRIDPDTDRDFVLHLHELVRMLRGETITGHWTEIEATLTVDRAMLFEGAAWPASLWQTKEELVEISGQLISLGMFTTILHSVDRAKSQPRNRRSARFVPASRDTFERRAGGVDAFEPTRA